MEKLIFAWLIVGTVVTVVGVLVMILYKGPNVNFVWSKARSHHSEVVNQDDQGSWLKGTFMLMGSCLCWSGFFVLQSNTVQSYPAKLSLTSLICFTGVVMSTIAALIAERGNSKPWIMSTIAALIAERGNSKPWIIGWDP